MGGYISRQFTGWAVAIYMIIREFAKSGVIQFIMQRVSAVLIASYVLCVMGFLSISGDIDYFLLRSYFSSLGMQVFSSLAVLAIMIHAWIGLWTIATDYLREHYLGRFAKKIRLLFQGASIFVLCLFGIWGLCLVWSL